MTNYSPTITKRIRRRKLRSGEVVRYARYFVNFRCPDTGRRRLPSFATKRQAEAFRDRLVADVHDEVFVDPRKVPTIAEAVDHWFEARRAMIKPSTLAGYKVLAKVITGPLLEGTARERCDYAKTGKLPRRDAKLLRMLGHIPANELATAEIRKWHARVREEVGVYTANRALSMLKSLLALVEEDFRIRAPAMPTNLARRASRPKKAILSPEQVGKLLAHAQSDPERGAYYAFPFLAGTRISEQLGLLWSEVDFDANLIRIRRIQERDGSLTECTKTEAGMRDIPMSPMLRKMLLEWRVTCPRLDGGLHRVFGGTGRLQPFPLPRKGGGKALSYHNFRRRIWAPVFRKLGLPYITPHAARHAFISTLQARGVEVGLVAKLAGHANPNVTLGHYTQAVRGGEEAMRALEEAYAG